MIKEIKSNHTSITEFILHIKLLKGSKSRIVIAVWLISQLLF